MKKMKNSRFTVTGMSCSACSSHVEKCVSKLKGVSKVSVNLLAGSMQVEYDETVMKDRDIVKCVKKAGYGAKALEEKEPVKADGSEITMQLKKESDGMKVRLILSIGFWLFLMYVAMGHMIFEWLKIPMPQWKMQYLHGNENAMIFAMTQVVLLVPILLLNSKYFTNGFRMLFKKNPNMDSLIAIGSSAAVVYGVFAMYMIAYGLGHNDMTLVETYRNDLYFESAGTIVTLITVGKYLEAKSKGKTGEAIQKLMKLVPKTVTVIRDEQEVVIEASELVVGDVFVVRPGEQIGADGVVTQGHSTVDESALTGESLPVEKMEKSTVLAASMNLNGVIKVEATKVGGDTAFSKILEIVDKASASKAPIARLADKIAGIFVPVVMGISLVTAVLWLAFGSSVTFALSSAIAVLVVSCPCALGLATPVAIMVGTGKGAGAGLLIKSGEALERTHGIDVVVLDKTGTITKGKPVVTDVVLEENVAEDKLLEIAYALEKGSEHPLAEAILTYCEDKNIEKNECIDFFAQPGMGVEGKIKGNAYFGGNAKMVEAKELTISASLLQKSEAAATLGKTPMFFGNEKKIMGFVAVADVVKETSREAIDKLKALSVKVVMLTGDQELTARAIGNEVGVDEVYAGVLPEGKGKIIEELRSKGLRVAMVGDGINDAPALALADVGIAIGAGCDVAIESADIILMKNDLLDVVNAIKLSKAVIRNIKQNLFWAFFYNCIGIPLAAGVFYPLWTIKLSPMFGAFAMSMSSLFVVTNALRLRYLKLEK